MHYSVKGLNRRQVEESRLAHGSNALSPVQKMSFWRKYAESLKDPIIIILLVALAINLVLFLFHYAEWFEGFGIALAVLVATSVTTLSEHKKESAFQKLQEESSRVSCKVIREGLVQLLSINDLVVGDSVILQPGDLVPADALVVLGELAVNQATLTGEPESVDKKPMPADENSEQAQGLADPGLVFRGTVVAEGEAVVEAIAVGDSTVYGKIFSELSGKGRLSPLQLRLSMLASGISKFGYFGGMAIFCSFLFKKILIDNAFAPELIVAYISNWQFFLHDIVTAVILTTIIIVVAVPEGLPMMIALVLSLNMRKMLRDNVLVRKLIGIETAGSLNLLFTDKTGTITEGRLEAVLFMTGDGAECETVREVPGELKHLLTVAIRQSSSCFIRTSEDGREEIIGGNLTDRALVNFIGITKMDSEEHFEVIKRIPFGSDKKYSAVQLKDRRGFYSLTFYKGAPEQILQQCDYSFDCDGNKVNISEYDYLHERINLLSDRAMRIIAVAASEIPLSDSSMPSSMSLIGFIAIRDQLRSNLVEVISETYQAGIQVVMLTGDKRKTAVAIARECGIMESDEGLVLSSQELAELSDHDLANILPRLRVVDRALPEDKSRLVKVAQNAGLVAGMTGDGVNDASALQNADVGFALGSGTEAAKEAGDIVILDDNISSVSKAVLYGRTIFNSIRKFIVFQFTVNLSVIITAFIGPFIGFDMPLTMIQLLWINLVMDTLAALAYGGEPPLKEYMLEKPKRRDESIINGEMWSSIIFNSFAVVAIAIIYLTAAPVRDLFHSEAAFMTGFFAFFVFIHNFNKFNTRTDRINLFYGISDNRGFLMVVALIFIVQVLFTYLGGDIMRTVGLSLNEWFFVFVISVIIIPLDLLRKLIRRFLQKRWNKNEYKLSALRAQA